MHHTLKWATGLCVAAASMLLVGESAIAQEASIGRQPRPLVNAEQFPLVAETLAEQMDDTFYSNDQNYYENRSIPRQILWFFGLSHTEGEINRDGAAVNRLVQRMWDEQTSEDALIRTRDLPNPYQSSLFLEPTIPPEDFGPTSIRQPIAAPPVLRNPVTSSPEPSSPVRALW
ncbi:MAG: hypothetical protein F6K09_39825 [Merismopedia sp. SIO2A8]|nr:hypothetical protein [Merismopedia sp. SIO2A8]